jgi:hypothetical protein
VPEARAGGGERHSLPMRTMPDGSVPVTADGGRTADPVGRVDGASPKPDTHDVGLRRLRRLNPTYEASGTGADVRWWPRAVAALALMADFPRRLVSAKLCSVGVA